MVSITGAGAGELSYQIMNEPAVESEACTVVGTEDDVAGSLVLAVSFDDPTYGWVAVGITLYGFSTATSLYTQADSVTILVTTSQQARWGLWTNVTGSSLVLKVKVTDVEGGRSYTGHFTAENLSWGGLGAQDTMVLTCTAYTFTIATEQRSA
jgi:hypothetical protein